MEEATQAATPAPLREEPPEFVAATVGGGKLDSTSFNGKPTVLWFWAPWCTVCRAEAPDVKAAAQAQDGAVQLVGIAGLGEEKAMEGFVSDTDMGEFTHVVDEDGKIWASFGVTAQPAYAFIKADGGVEVVPGSLSESELAQRMSALVGA